MKYLIIILPKLLNLGILLLLGIYAVYRKILTKDNLKVLQGLLMNIFLPFLSFNLLMEQQVTFRDLWDLKKFVLAQLCIYPVMATIAWLSCRIMKMTKQQENVHRGAMISGNYAYVVIPLIYALYQGTHAAVYIPIGCSIEALIIWTIGVSFFSKGKNQSPMETLKKIMNPTTVAVLLGFIVNSLGIVLPDILLSTIAQVGAVSTPLGMCYLGASLCFMEWKNMSNLIHALVYVATRMVLVPVLAFSIAKQFFPEVESIVLMLTCASPSTTLSVMFAKQYGQDADYAGELVSVSTLSMVVTIPLIFLIIGILPF